MRDAVEIDVAVFGGGIAGLWLLSRLRALGFDAHLFEKTVLGSGQTIASQGIIHSGVKYTFDGVNRPQTEALSSMPKIWMDCIEGRGEVDLRGTEILATNQLMFTTGGLVNRIAGAFATKALRSDVGALERDKFPELFQTREFSGKIYQLEEPVLAARSVLAALRRKCGKFIYHAENFEIRRENDRVIEVRAQDSVVRPRSCIFTSGSGNEWFAERLGLDKARVTQRRPLRMFLARGLPHRVYAHCLVPEPKPRVTITTHHLNDGNVWYLGGNIAEKAVGMNDAEALRWAHAEMTDIFPWLDWAQVRWAIHDVDRAEPAASKLLPSGPTLTTVGNAALAWPTKLALAPALASQALRWLEQQNVAPSNKTTQLPLPSAEVARYPWEEVCEWIQL
jgi:glycine/D-amino acid oxidase-like deaminating enzyme